MKIDRKKVDEVMATQGITPKIVAERLGVSQSVLSGMWNGKRDSRVATVHKIADALRVKAKEIVV